MVTMNRIVGIAAVMTTLAICFLGPVNGPGWMATILF
jgi:hypothetical protein